MFFPSDLSIKSPPPGKGQKCSGINLDSINWRETSMKIINKKEVQARTGLSSVTIWRLEKAGKLPKRVNITPSRVGWVDEETDEWIARRPRGICAREIGKLEAKSDANL